MNSITDDFRRWEERAEEARSVAEMMHSPSARRMMFDVAEGYDKLARRARERVANRQEEPAPIELTPRPLAK